MRHRHLWHVFACILTLTQSYAQVSKPAATSTITAEAPPPLTEIITSVVTQASQTLDPVTVWVTKTNPQGSSVQPPLSQPSGSSEEDSPTEGRPSLPVVVTASPSEMVPARSASISIPQDGNFTAEYKFFGWKGCDERDKEAIKDAMKEARTILDAHCVQHFDDCKHSMVTVDFFGRPMDMHQRKNAVHIQQNFRNAYAFADSGWPWSRHQLQIFCHDESMEGSSKSSCSAGYHPNPIVVIRDYMGSKKPAMMFCNSWFQLSRLGDATRNGLRAAGDEPYNLQKYENRGRTFITAMMMVPKIAPWPSTHNGPSMNYFQKDFRGQIGRRYVTTAGLCKYLAKYRVSSDRDWSHLVENADTYSWYAMAAYLQGDRLLGEYPVLPFVYGDAGVAAEFAGSEDVDELNSG
ncbi:hypothetical protein CKM354_000883000 [Cercospora kikuchii]|uniref:Uncharacterized protein n=1 Tax=Cercospora kikuchii TaxID=84275 RepID=A0A9P3CWK2_9PEZI|nr:uncharacterized protein CKM354_000883000 [Cercospora kikuchii]GIZ45673.1 hypothetical protein CKM354_000883000 [Cercospora kikuchii]